MGFCFYVFIYCNIGVNYYICCLDFGGYCDYDVVGVIFVLDFKD